MTPTLESRLSLGPLCWDTGVVTINVGDVDDLNTPMVTVITLF